MIYGRIHVVSTYAEFDNMFEKLKQQTNLSFTLKAYYMWFYQEAESLRAQSSMKDIGGKNKENNHNPGLSKFAPSSDNS